MVFASRKFELLPAPLNWIKPRGAKIAPLIV
jgi:hypothetical protein